jgi:hypothetical protein
MRVALEVPTAPAIDTFPEASTAAPLAHPTMSPIPTGKIVKLPFSQQQGATAALDVPTTPERNTFPVLSIAMLVTNPYEFPAPRVRKFRAPFAQ